MKALVQAVRVHAKTNYEHDGWDVVEECWEDREIEEELQRYGIKTEKEAISHFLKNIARPYDDRRRDVQTEAF